MAEQITTQFKGLHIDPDTEVQFNTKQNGILSKLNKKPNERKPHKHLGIQKSTQRICKQHQTTNDSSKTIDRILEKFFKRRGKKQTSSQFQFLKRQILLRCAEVRGTLKTDEKPIDTLLHECLTITDENTNSDSKTDSSKKISSSLDEDYSKKEIRKAFAYVLNKHPSITKSCSEEARCPTPPNINVHDNELSVLELAAYFDEMIYIPREMSVMAEMMYR